MHLNSKDALNRQASLENRLWVYCGVFALTVMLAGLLLLFSYTLPTPSAAAQSVATPRPGAAGTVWAHALNLRLATFMAFVLAASLVFALAIKRCVMIPVKKMNRQVALMAAGNLNQTIAPQAHFELHELGQHINLLITDFQEVLLLIWNHSEHANTLLSQLGSDTSGLSSESLAHLNALRQELHHMQALVKTFEFYDVHLKDGKTQSHARASQRRHS